MIKNAQRALRNLERYISEIAELLVVKEEAVQCLPHGRRADMEALTIANLRVTLEAMEMRAAALRSVGARAAETRKALRANADSFRHGSTTTAVCCPKLADSSAGVVFIA